MSDPLAPAPSPAPTVTVRLPDGRVGDVPADQADAIAGSGGAILSPDDIRAVDREAEFGGLGGEAVAGGLGLLRGASMGLSDPLAVGLADLTMPALPSGANGGGAVREQLAGYKTENEGASTLGELAGMLTPGGAAGLVGKLGQATERGLAGMLGKGASSAVGRIAQHGLASAAGGAVEGGLYGLGSEISEDALGNHELTAQKLVGSTLTGAMFGGALGSLLGVGGQSAREGGRIASSGIASVQGAVKGAATSGLRAAERGADMLVGAGRGIIESVPGGRSLLAGDLKGITAEARDYLDTTAGQLAARTDEPAVKKALERVYREGKLNAQAQEEILDASTRSVVKDAKAALDADRVVYEVGLEQKGEHFAPLVDLTKRAQQKEAALSAWQTVREFQDFWASTASKGGAEGGLKKFGKIFADFEAELGDAVSKGSMIANPEKAFLLLDQLKRDSGHGAQFGRMPWERAEAAGGKVTPSFENVYNKLRGILEDEAVWGKAALAQKEINAAHTVSLGTRDSFGKWFVEKYGAAAGEPLFELNPASVKSFLSDIDGAGMDLKARAFTDYGAGMRAKMDAMEKWAVLTPKQKAAFDGARRGLDQMEASFAAARDEARYVATVRKMRSGEGERGMLDSAAPLAGSLIAGPIGAAGGLASNIAIDAVTRPLTTAERLRSMRLATEKVDAAWDAAVKGIFGKKGGAPSIQMPRETVEHVMREVQHLSANSAAMVERVSRAFGSINSAAPKVATAVGSTAQRAVTFLASKSPREPIAPASFTPHLSKAPRLSDTEVSTFARYLRGTLDPLSVVDDMKHGTITPESVEALRTVYPQKFVELQERVHRELSERDTEVPYNERLLLWGLLDIPGDPTMGTEFLAEMHAAQATDAESAPGGGAAPAGGRARQTSKTVAKSYQTQSQRIEAS